MVQCKVNTLSPACKMETGKDGSGLELSHIRKFGSTSVSGWDILKIAKTKIFLYTTVISLTKSWFKRNSLLFLMCIFSWLATFSSTIPQLVILHMTLVYYLHIKWCYNIDIIQIANHWWRRCGSLHGIKGYHSNSATYLTLSCSRPTYRFYSV